MLNKVAPFCRYRVSNAHQSKLSLPPHKRPYDVDTIKKLLSMCWYMKIKMINQLLNHSVACSDDCSCAAGCDLVVGGEL